MTSTIIELANCKLTVTIGINDYLRTISVNCKLHAYNPQF